jgi:hypothetical protein
MQVLQELIEGQRIYVVDVGASGLRVYDTKTGRPATV